MNLELTEEQRAIQSVARDFADKEVRPIAEAIDREARFPAETVRRMGELGLMGLFIPEECGGSGADVVAYALAGSILTDLTREPLGYDRAGSPVYLRLAHGAPTVPVQTPGSPVSVDPSTALPVIDGRRVLEGATATIGPTRAEVAWALSAALRAVTATRIVASTSPTPVV